jgi:hypothetical protein
MTVRWLALCLVALLTPSPSAAQDYELGRNGWQLERLAQGFVLLRTEIFSSESGGRLRRQGLLVLTCDRQARRIRFQIGDAPRQPSTQASQYGRAMVRGRREGGAVVTVQLVSRVRFFDDGSFELLEAVGFSDPAMREFLHLLKKLPKRLEVLLFKGPETGVFLRATALQFDTHGLDESLADIYGFEGLCFRSPD